MAITIPWSDDPELNRRRIEQAMAIGEREINGELDENGKPKPYPVDRVPVPVPVSAKLVSVDMNPDRFFDLIQPSALAYRETLEATYDLARVCVERRVPGDFVECGVYAGAQAAVMALAILDHVLDHTEPHINQTANYLRRVHLFDSFQGLPAADERDQEIWQHHGAKTGESACSLEAVMNNMRAWGIPDEVLVYHKGWFAETVPAFSGPIALLRLDADLYSSTSVCVQHLYPMVSRGGWVIIDDWNLTGCRQAVSEVVVPAPIYWRIPTK